MQQDTLVNTDPVVNTEKTVESHKGFWFTVAGLTFSILLALTYINGMNIYDQDRFVTERAI